MGTESEAAGHGVEREDLPELRRDRHAVERGRQDEPPGHHHRPDRHLGRQRATDDRHHDRAPGEDGDRGKHGLGATDPERLREGQEEDRRSLEHAAERHEVGDERDGDDDPASRQRALLTVSPR